MRTVAASVAVLLLGSSTAFPFAHLWDIQEVYTNADGSIQFVEFFTTGPAEFFLSATQMDLKLNGVSVNTYHFPNDLSGPTTANHTFLAATANFAPLFGIIPDYIIPANFLASGSNRLLDYGQFDVVSLADLPTDGTRSLNGMPGNDIPTSTSVNAVATPRNFAGLEVTIPEPTAALLLCVGALATLAISRRRVAICVT